MTCLRSNFEVSAAEARLRGNLGPGFLARSWSARDEVVRQEIRSEDISLERHTTRRVNVQLWICES